MARCCNNLSHNLVGISAIWVAKVYTAVRVDVTMSAISAESTVSAVSTVSTRSAVSAVVTVSALVKPFIVTMFVVINYDTVLQSMSTDGDDSRFVMRFKFY